jgi:hypothetical protein
VTWFHLEKGKTYECPVCSQVFQVTFSTGHNTAIVSREIACLQDIGFSLCVSWHIPNQSIQRNQTVEDTMSSVYVMINILAFRSVCSSSDVLATC